MKNIQIITLGLAALTPLGFAQEASSTTRSQQAQRADQEQGNTHLVKLNTLKGMSVNNRVVEDSETKMEKVADFADLIVTGRAGESRYVLLSRGGIGSLGDTLIPVPSSMVTTSWARPEDKDEDPKIRVFTDLSAKRLSDAPEFDSETWKKGGFPWNRVAGYYGMDDAKSREAAGGRDEGKTRTASATQEPLFRLSELMGNDLHDPMGEKIADVQNVVLEPNSMKVAYIVVGSGGVLGIGEELRAIPFQALDHTRGTDGKVKCTTKMTKAQLEAAPKFDPDQWANQGTTRFAQSVRESCKMTEQEQGR